MKYEWSELFTSIEGEGPYSGIPTTYIRFSRCNFTCGKFNNPDNIVDKKGYAPLTFEPADIEHLSEMEPVEIGCDTQYAVNPKFKHIWHYGDEDDLAKAVMAVVPHNSWVHPTTGQEVMLSLTGGEPTLQWKKLPTLLNHPLFDHLQTVLIETNAAVPFKQSFVDDLGKWIENGLSNGIRRKIVWSNSPKLSASGESWDKAIKPNIALLQREVLRKQVLLEDDQLIQYFKFVCGPTEKDFNEVEKAMQAYYKAGIPRNVGVLIMPMSCTESQQIDIAAQVADMCIDKGYTYCHRVHNSVYANAIGK